MAVNVFLPCRRASQRVPKKNTRPFGVYEFGLLEIKLLQLLRVKRIDKIYVSSNDGEVLSFASSLKSSKISVVERSDDLSSNTTKTDELVRYVREIIQNGSILWTHVTSPFFTDEDYDKAIEVYCKNVSKYDSLMSVTPLYGFFWDKVKPINYDRRSAKWPFTQDTEPIFEINSACFLADYYVYETKQDRIGDNPLMYLTNRIKGIDIDWEEDFEMAEKMLLSNQALVGGGGLSLKLYTHIICGVRSA